MNQVHRTTHDGRQGRDDDTFLSSDSFLLSSIPVIYHQPAYQLQGISLTNIYGAEFLFVYTKEKCADVGREDVSWNGARSSILNSMKSSQQNKS